MAQNLAQTLRENLSKGVVFFKFTKADGTVREAFGTRSGMVIEGRGGQLPTGTREPAQGTIPFWDVECEAWRSCKEDSIICVSDFVFSIIN